MHSDIAQPLLSLNASGSLIAAIVLGAMLISILVSVVCRVLVDEINRVLLAVHEGDTPRPVIPRRTIPAARSQASPSQPGRTPVADPAILR